MRVEGETRLGFVDEGQLGLMQAQAAQDYGIQTYSLGPLGTESPSGQGGSIPIVALFEDVLKVKTILMGFGLDSDALHSPTEHYGLFNFYKGIETIPYFFKFYAELKA